MMNQTAAFGQCAQLAPLSLFSGFSGPYIDAEKDSSIARAAECRRRSGEDIGLQRLGDWRREESCGLRVYPSTVTGPLHDGTAAPAVFVETRRPSAPIDARTSLFPSSLQPTRPTFVLREYVHAVAPRERGSRHRPTACGREHAIIATRVDATALGRCSESSPCRGARYRFASDLARSTISIRALLPAI